jgi:nitroreductase
MIRGKGFSEEIIEAYMQKYSSFIDIRSDEEIEFWASKQCYIAGANMMNSSAMIGIDSCAIEGMDRVAVEKYLQLPSNIKVSFLIAFGKRFEEPKRAKTRLTMSELIIKTI